MDRKSYLPRIVDRQLQEYLKTFGAVCVEGPKWCGKTWTSSFHSKSEIFIGDPAGNFQNRQLAQLSPALVLEGETPRLIDEWQEDNLSSPAPPRRTTRASCTAARDGSPGCACGPCRCTNPVIPPGRYPWRRCAGENCGPP